MINRILIRIKVLQIVYAFYQNKNGNLDAAEKELLFSMQKSYDLYHYFLLLILDVTNLYERITDSRKHRLRPTEEDLKPNTRLIENRFAKQLATNTALKKYAAKHGLTWGSDADRDFVRQTLELLLSSEPYAAYIASPDDSYKADREFWRVFFKKHICGNEQVEGYLEDKSIYWNDDIDIVETFTLKTIKRFEEANGGGQALLPMFKDEEDHEFAVKLLRQSLLKEDEFREQINRHMKNWESERIAQIDLLIMQIALAEIVTFPSIPVNVTLNEYIDAAKYYSTPKSGTFINGILDAIVDELRKEKVLFKE